MNWDSPTDGFYCYHDEFMMSVFIFELFCISTSIKKIAAVMELPSEFAVEKCTAIVQGLRPKWTHAVARFYTYVAAPQVAQEICDRVQRMCDGAVMRILGHDIAEVDEWSLTHARLRAMHGGLGLMDLLTDVRLRALRSFVDAGASLQKLGPLVVDMWARIQTEHGDLPLGMLRSRMQFLLDQLGRFCGQGLCGGRRPVLS